MTGQTDDFIDKLDQSLISGKIDLRDEPHLSEFDIKAPHLLVLPSYEQYPYYDDIAAISDHLGDNLIGVIGSGNVNFDDKYLITAKVVCEENSLPFLYGFEFSGTEQDVEEVNALLRQYI